MAYPPSSQRPPPMRQYAPSPASAPAPYAQDDMYGAGDYAPDYGPEDPGYGYQAGPPAPYSSSQAPRSMRPPGPPGPGRPPNGRGYPGDRPPPQKRRGPPRK